MADFLSSLGDKVIPNKDDVLNRKIDYQRETFLKGVSNTKYGKKEDPTYLHFKFIFDFGNTSYLDPETFLAPSPLFRSLNKVASDQDIRNLSGDIFGVNPEDKTLVNTASISPLTAIEGKNAGNFYSDMDFFYGSKQGIPTRDQGNYNINGGGVAYYGAQEYLFQRSKKRQEMLEAFKKGLSFVNEKCPYYFQSVSGLDQLLKVDIKNLHKPGGKPQRMGTLTIDCLESIDMRMFSLSELYRKAIYDYTYHRTMVPENLRKFRMWLVVTEIRNIQLKNDINDVLNPFSIPSVANAANFLDSFNSQTGFLNNTQGILQKSTGGQGSEYQDKFGSYTMGPYAFIYQFDQCEFDFDDSYPYSQSIDNKGGTAVSSKFKIHVGRVKDYKLQFNLLSDVLKKDDNIKSMVLSDVWGSPTKDYNDYDYDGTQGVSSLDFSTDPNPSEYFAQLASNFITNTVADLKNQGVSILQGALLGNIYGMGGINIGASTSSAQSLISTLKGGIPNPFADNTPQAKGLGGPSERAYPTLNEDAYTGTPSQTQQNLGNSYGSSAVGPAGSNLGDTYPTVPEKPQYPSNKSDEYKEVPGKDLGAPGRIYPKPSGDVYPTVPEKNQYPTNKSDEYKGVPGKDSGVPDRVYTPASGDVYPSVPEKNQYPAVNADEYKDVPGKDSGVPARVYPPASGDVYPNVPGTDLGAPDRQYSKVIEDVYPPETPVNTNTLGTAYNNLPPQYTNVSGKEYDKPGPTTPPVMDDVYSNNPYTYPTLLEQRAYKDPDPRREEPMGDAYSNDPVVNNNPSYSDRVYKDNKFYTMGANMGDIYPNVPGSDLGGQGRYYPGVNDSEYNQVSQPRPTNLGRSYPSS